MEIGQQLSPLTACSDAVICHPHSNIFASINRGAIYNANDGASSAPTLEAHRKGYVSDELETMG